MGPERAKIVCGYVADASHLFELLCTKLDEEFELRAIHNFPNAAAAHEVILVPLVPESGSRRLPELETIARLSAILPTIAIVTAGDSRSTTDAMEAGAFACWSERDSIEELQGIIRRAAYFQSLQKTLDQLSSAAPGSHRPTIIGRQQIASLISLGVKLANCDVNVLITGESGTGKEAFARLVHEAGPRANAPFVAVACSSLPETLIESELFGHERGAFTGAVSGRRGRFEEVGAGTLFLDEIGELSPAVQVKLLRVLQERTFERLGSSRPIRCNARIVFATHQSLRALTASGKFRLDLYYRLTGAQIHLPALRERKEDILLLAEYFIACSAARQRKPVPVLSDEALAMLLRHDWPGNVRELENVLEVVVALIDDRVIQPSHLRPHLPDLAEDADELDASGLMDGSFEEEVRAFKRRLIERKLMEHHNNKLQAARALGLARSSLHRLIDELHIDGVRHRVSKEFPLDS
jgi:DNA-binding NtrC family response regulator